MEWVAIKEETMVCDLCLKCSMNLLLKEERICVNIEFADLIGASTVRLTRVQCVRVKDNFNVKRKQIQWKKFLLRHQKTNKSWIYRHHELHDFCSARPDWFFPDLNYRRRNSTATCMEGKLHRVKNVVLAGLTCSRIYTNSIYSPLCRTWQRTSSVYSSPII